MAVNELKTRILLNGRTTEEWESLKNSDNTDFTPMKNELCYDSTLGKIKFGDGVTSYKELPYITYNLTEIEELVNKLKNSDAMVFRGTLGENGKFTEVPTTNIIQGDTYKISDEGTYAGYSCKIGDLIIANKSSGDETLTADTTNWDYVPSGDERETTLAYTTDTPSITTKASTGNVTVGEAATKQVDVSISDNTTSSNLPTSQAVNDRIVTYAPKIDGTNATGTWGINVSGSASKLETPRNIELTEGAIGSGSFDGSADVSVQVTEVCTSYLKNKEGDVLILNGSID